MTQYSEWNRIISAHTIKLIQYFSFRARYPRLHGKNAQKDDHGYGGDVTIARLTTQLGLSGWASLSCPIEEAKEMESFLSGKRLSDVFDCENGILDEKYHGFDLPLHDLAGRAIGEPVYRMLSPVAKPLAKVYDGAIYMNDFFSAPNPCGVQRVINDCLDDYALGYRTLKVKIGRGKRWMDHDEGLKRDIELIRDIHAALPDAALMVDANDGYSVADSIAFLEGINDVPLYWFEEPFREEECANQELKSYLSVHRPQTLVADGESMTDIPLLTSLAEKGLFDVWQPDVCGYGFTPWRRLMRMIQAKGYLASPHAWGDVVKTYYCAHLAAAYPQHIPCVEAVLGTSEGVDDSGYVFKNGILHLPEAPGFGMELYWAREIQ